MRRREKRMVERMMQGAAGLKVAVAVAVAVEAGG